MKKYSKEERLRISEQLLASEGWEWYESEIKNQIELMMPTLHQTMDNVEDRVYRDGVIAGILWALNRPRTVKKETEGFIYGMIQKIKEGI